MPPKKQQTLSKPISISGYGLHSGLESTVRIMPGRPNQGIVFNVMDCNRTVSAIELSVASATCGDLRTVLQGGEHRIETVEHVLAALVGCGVDNAVIQVWGTEIPILDGSTHAWVCLIEDSGPLIVQPADLMFARILKRVYCSSDTGWCALEPDAMCDSLLLSYDMSYDHPSIGQQSLQICLTKENFKNHLSRARTFGFFNDLDVLQSKGLALGASLYNTLVFDDHGVKNRLGLIWDDEPVRHKIVDAVGDLSLFGYRIRGRFIGYRSGHRLNQSLVRHAMADRSTWTLET